MLNNKQIVCVSTHYWDDPWFRKQHFMSRFHKKGYKIAYIEPSFSMLRKVDVSKNEYATNKFFSTGIEEKDKGLFIIKPFRYLPFWTRPLINKVNILILSFFISSVLKKIGFKDYILWIYRPEFTNSLRMFNYKKIVFDITDDLAAYDYNNKSKYIYIKNCMEYLAKKSDLTIVTAYTLFENFKHITPNIHLIPNGYDSNLFAEENIMSPPLEMKDIHKPIIGFIGTIFSFLDFELLRYIIDHNPNNSFVFIGNCEANSKREWEAILKYKNVYWLGKKKKESIPGYIKFFDVCINPFKIDSVSRSVSPLKVFEYLAMKKPVISSDMESLKREKISKLIYFAKDYDEFDYKLKFALNNRIDSSNYQCVKDYSWDSLFNKVYSLINNNYE
jgi:glycosyltransferase involved in cell wall biosynthesis